MCVRVCSVDLSLLNFVYDFCLGGVGFRDYPCGGPFFVVIILAGVTTLVGVHSLNQSLVDVENFRKLEGVHFFHSHVEKYVKVGFSIRCVTLLFAFIYMLVEQI